MTVTTRWSRYSRYYPTAIGLIPWGRQDYRPAGRIAGRAVPDCLPGGAG